MNKITPFLWFNSGKELEEAMSFYTSVFENAKITQSSPMPDSGFMMASFELEGQEFTALNGGPLYKFNEAISFFVSCDTQEEIDDKWEKLTADGGEEGNCGWLKDKFGLSWQIVPPILGELMGAEDREKAGRAIAAMMKMHKLDIAELQKAFDGE